MEPQKMLNLLNDSSDEESKFAKKNWYVTDSQRAKWKYNLYDSITFDLESIKWSLCVCSDAFILVTGDITVNTDNNTDVAFKNCAPFSALMFLLMKQIIFTLQCPCTIWSNMVIIIQIHHNVCGSLKEMQFLLILLIWVLTILNHSNKKQLL